MGQESYCVCPCQAVPVKPNVSECGWSLSGAGLKDRPQPSRKNYFRPNSFAKDLQTSLFNIFVSYRDKSVIAMALYETMKILNAF